MNRRKKVDKLGRKVASDKTMRLYGYFKKPEVVAFLRELHGLELTQEAVDIISGALRYSIDVAIQELHRDLDGDAKERGEN